MGNDGGSVPQGSDLRKVKKALKKTDHTEQNRTRWLTCALSKATLAAPIVADLVGNIFNKESVIKALIGKSLPKEYSHIRSLKDVFEVKFNPNKAYTVNPSSDKGVDGFVSPYDCPITGRPVNGVNAFSAIKTCGHVFSEKGLRETEKTEKLQCAVCTGAYTKHDVVILNPPSELQEELRHRLLSIQKEGRESHKKRKAESLGDDKTKEKEKGDEKTSEPAPKKHKSSETSSTSTSSSHASTPSTVVGNALAVKVTLQKAENVLQSRKTESETYKALFHKGNSSETAAVPNFTGLFMK